MDYRLLVIVPVIFFGYLGISMLHEYYVFKIKNKIIKND